MRVFVLDAGQAGDGKGGCLRGQCLDVVGRCGCVFTSFVTKVDRTSPDLGGGLLSRSDSRSREEIEELE